MPPQGSLLAAVIIKPHGVRGEVLVESYLEGNVSFKDIKEITLVPPQGTPEKLKLLSARLGAKGWLLKIEGIENRQEAEKLRGANIEIDRSLLPATEEGEFYYHDLIGSQVVTCSGGFVGVVEGVFPRAEQDLLVVVSPEGKEKLIPATEPIIVEVDIEAGKIVIDPPDGLLEL